MAPQAQDRNYYKALMGGDQEDLEAQVIPHPHEQIPFRPPPPYSAPLTSWSSRFIANKAQLVQQRVIKLFNLQHKHTELMMQYQEEALALERKYQQLLQPLYEERKATITGLHDKSAALSPKSRGTQNGIPDFWLHAMKNEPSIAELIASRDEAVLSQLKDIKLESLQDGKNGFMLVFMFGVNEFFWNETIKKTYIYIRAADSGDVTEDIYSSEYTYHESIGDFIDWKDGRNLIEEREEDEDDAQQESFFTFFSPPVKQEIEDGEEKNEEQRRYEWLVDLDFDYGEVFKEKVIPYAVYWYTGEAALYEDVDEDDDDDEDNEDDEDDNDSDHS